uniref:Uncharacterized protein n=2 Tax=Oryza sativa subsp. japonica TaxID=39947 RepID=Q8L4D1_ORYSJ|nr:hypothetical protein [Oryza sativa Japonica Group]AAM93729.1 hypothetical protein [Oryza sativa Japonica Group]AAP54135.1 hypothetical protein LOC_Os10g32372 [Oryza sativa Japonica Group]AAP54140.1 hypothetical protein LOC_Os10g32324 [Oryza sativa Japonica Group]
MTVIAVGIIGNAPQPSLGVHLERPRGGRVEPSLPGFSMVRPNLGQPRPPALVRGLTGRIGSSIVRELPLDVEDNNKLPDVEDGNRLCELNMQLYLRAELNRDKPSKEREVVD